MVRGGLGKHLEYHDNNDSRSPNIGAKVKENSTNLRFVSWPETDILIAFFHGPVRLWNGYHLGEGIDPSALFSHLSVAVDAEDLPHPRRCGVRVVVGGCDRIHCGMPAYPKSVESIDTWHMY